jgi:peptide-methionine (S)-S-oxide reductase
MDQPKAKSKQIEYAILGAGCFWCTEAVFQLIQGVETVEPGYAGGELPNPSYEQVSTGRTGYVEAAKITFDTNVITFREILEIFFGTHDPTTLNRQGADVGTQYRSVIFYNTLIQKITAEEIINELNREKVYNRPIVTSVEPLKTFYPAENYHKDYYLKHPHEPYCQAVIAPKVAKLEKTFISKLKIL